MQRTKNSEIKLCPFNELKGLLSNGGTAMSHCAKNEGIWSKENQGILQ